MQNLALEEELEELYLQEGVEEGMFLPTVPAQGFHYHFRCCCRLLPLEFHSLPHHHDFWIQMQSGHWSKLVEPLQLMESKIS